MKPTTLKSMMVALGVLLSLNAHAYAYVDGIYYNLDTSAKTATVTSGDNKYTGSVYIPSSFNYNGSNYSVTRIGESAFSGCSGLTSLTIPNSVTSIGNFAFNGCSGLTSITIPSSVTSIGYSAFYNTPWYNNQPDGMVYAGNVAYEYKGTMPNNTEIIIKDGTTGIAGAAFSDCSGLTSITIPNSVTSIGGSAFSNCRGLTSITIPNGVTSIGNYAFDGCSGLTSITIPNSVTSIGSSAFSNCRGLTSITIPNSVTRIGDNAFSWCSGLTSITIPNSVTSIGYSAFSGCSGLTSITIPNSVTSIGYGAFEHTEWLRNQKDGIIYAGKVAYTYKGTMADNTNMVLKDGTIGIAGRAFSGCSGLTSITIPNSVTSIGNNAFGECSGLTSITIPNGVTSIGSSAFYECTSLTSINIPSSVTSIGYEAFHGCSGLTSVTIPNSVTSIGSSAFFGCSGLTSITIPSSVTSIGSSAFFGCSGLTSVTIPNSVTSIDGSTFRECSGLTSITIPNSVTTIGNQAFCNCMSLEAISFSDNITSVGSMAFSSTPWFRNMENGPVYIGKVLYAYRGIVPENAEIVVKEGTVSISPSAFSGCYNLTSITIPNSVTSIGSSAFYGCSSLTSITIPNGVTSIKWSAFSGCSGLTSITIPNSVTYIDNEAFYHCSGLTSITIPNSVTSIGSSAFNGCSGLTSVISEIKEPFAFGSSGFSGISSDCVLTVPYGTKDAYIAAGWTEDVFKGGIVEAEPVTEPSTDNTLALTDTQVIRGRQVVLPVDMSNTEDITAIQFDLTLPAGVSIAKNTKGKYIVEKTERCADHTLTASKPGEANVYKVLMYSTEVESITGNEGAVINVTLEVAENMEAGDYEVRISSINLTTKAEKKISPADATCVLTVRNSIPGDANGDGVIDVTDIVGIANGILDHASESFDAVAADVNGDGSVDVTDIVVVANIILHDGGANAVKVREAMQMLDPQ